MFRQIINLIDSIIAKKKARFEDSVFNWFNLMNFRLLYSTSNCWGAVEQRILILVLDCKERLVDWPTKLSRTSKKYVSYVNFYLF